MRIIAAEESMSFMLLPAFLLSELKLTLLFGFTLLLCELFAFGLVLLLHTYSMSSLLEVMISGNFNESFVSNKKADIEELADNYREQFEKCSVFIENISSKTLTNNVLKGIGAASGTAGKVFSSIPVVKKGHVAKALKNKSEEIKTNTRENDEKGVKEFSLFHNPQINIFVEKLDDIVRINKTSKVAVTDDKIYLIQDTNI